MNNTNVLFIRLAIVSYKKGYKNPIVLYVLPEKAGF